MEEYVNKQEFEILKRDVQDLKESRKKDSQLLSMIDKKIDIIFERLSNTDKTEDIKMQQLISRVAKIEENQSWLWKLCASIIITGIIGAVVTFK